MRDFGAYPSANSAFLLYLGLEPLALRLERYCENAKMVAEYFAASDKVERVSYPGLEGDRYYPLTQKYLKGASGVISFVIKGGKENAIKFMDGLKLASIEVHVADIRTSCCAGKRHRQLTGEQLVVGANPGLIRFSVDLRT